MLSPLDPVFWLHHCNVDRMWEVWKVKQEKRGTDKALPYDLPNFTRKAWFDKELRISFQSVASDADRKGKECPPIDAGARTSGTQTKIPGMALVSELLETIQWGYVYDDPDVMARVAATPDGTSGFAIVSGGIAAGVTARGAASAKTAAVLDALAT